MRKLRDFHIMTSQLTRFAKPCQSQRRMVQPTALELGHSTRLKRRHRWLWQHLRLCIWSREHHVNGDVMQEGISHTCMMCRCQEPRPEQIMSVFIRTRKASAALTALLEGAPVTFVVTDTDFPFTTSPSRRTDHRRGELAGKVEMADVFKTSAYSDAVSPAKSHIISKLSSNHMEYFTHRSKTFRRLHRQAL